MTEIEQQRFPGSPAAAASQATIVEQTRAAAEVAAAVQAARMVPRDPERAFDQMRAACRRWETAKRAFYAYPQGGKTVQGPTVALARDLGAFWGNVDYGTVELSRDDVARRSEVRAWAWDQETNTRVSRSVIVPHVGYVGASGRALTEMRAIDQNNNSVAGRASRETLFAILPTEFVEEARALCQQTLDEGGGVPIPQRIEEILSIFGKARPPITQQLLEGYVGHPRGRWTGNDVAALFVLFESLRAHTITRQEAFPDEGGITSDDIREQAAATGESVAGTDRIVQGVKAARDRVKVTIDAEPVVEDPPGMDPTDDPSWGKGNV